MKINIAPTFSKSIKRIIWHESKVYKIYSIFRYDIWRFLGNIWKFKKELYEFRAWDYRYNLSLLSKSIELTRDNIEHGFEVDITRNKKVSAMNELIHILDTICNNSFIDLAENELGELPHINIEFEPCEDNPGFFSLVDNYTTEEKELRDKVYKRSDEIEKEYWDRLLYLLKGKDYSEFNKNIPNNLDTDSADELYNYWFDGSGIRGWWN